MKPTAVIRAAQEADRRIAEQRQAMDAEASEAGAPGNVEPSPGENQVQADPSQPQGGQPVQQVPAREHQEPQGTPTGDLQKEVDEWRQRYRTLQGMYNGMMGQVDSLQKLLATMQSQQQASAAPTAPTKPVQGNLKLINDDEITEYGADLIDVVKRAAKEELLPVIDSLQRENAELKNRLGGVTQQVSVNSKEKFFENLGRKVPDWESINEHPEYLKWLDEADPFTGIPRQQLLDDAYAKFNVDRTAQFFLTWKGLQGIQQQAPAAGSNRMERMVSPGRSKGGVAPAQQGKIWTRAEISNFYRVKAGLAKDEAEKIERDIFKAQQEGRIQ